jgi:hypothetical protein
MQYMYVRQTRYQYVFRKTGNGVDVQEHVLASPYEVGFGLYVKSLQVFFFFQRILSNFVHFVGS